MPKIPVYGRNRNVISQDASVRLQNMPVGRDDTLVNALGTLAKIGEATANVFQAREQVQDDDNLSEIQLKTHKNSIAIDSHMVENYNQYENFSKKKDEIWAKNTEEIQENIQKLSPSAKKRAEIFLKQQNLNIKHKVETQKVQSQIKTDTTNGLNRVEEYSNIGDSQSRLLAENQLLLLKSRKLISESDYEYRQNILKNKYTLQNVQTEISSIDIPQIVIDKLKNKNQEGNFLFYKNISLTQRDQLINIANNKIKENSQNYFTNLESQLVQNQIPEELEIENLYQTKKITEDDRNRSILIIRKNKKIIQQQNDDTFITALDNDILDGKITEENILATKKANKEISAKGLNIAKIKTRNAKTENAKQQKEQEEKKDYELEYEIWNNQQENEGALSESKKFAFNKIIEDRYLATRQFDKLKKFKEQISKGQIKIKNTYAYQYGHGYINELDNSRFDKFEWDDDSWLNRDSEKDLKLGKKYIQFRFDNFISQKQTATEDEIKKFIDKEMKILNKTNLIKVFDEAAKIKVK